MSGAEDDLAPETADPRWARWAVGSGAVLALGFLVVLFLTDAFGDPTVVSAEIVGEGVAVAAAWTPEEGGTLSVGRTEGAPAPGRVHELWAIYGEAAPMSVGLLPDGPFAVRFPFLLPDDMDVKLAVSEEPAGGSEADEPSGTIVAEGVLSAD